jgi:hypothetical protein
MTDRIYGTRITCHVLSDNEPPARTISYASPNLALDDDGLHPSLRVTRILQLCGALLCQLDLDDEQAGNDKPTTLIAIEAAEAVLWPDGKEIVRLDSSLIQPAPPKDEQH